MGDFLELHAQSKGRVGEYFAAYVLEANGIETHRVDVHHADLWCRLPRGFEEVEVKSVTSPKRYGNHRTEKYFFNVSGKKRGWYCFVALDRQLLLMRPVSEVQTTSSHSISTMEFNAENQRRTIEEFLKSC